MILSVLAIKDVEAQKLSAVQETSVFAPAGIRIDGKAAEWGPAFQAYNKTTRIFYTLANDRNTLYLTVHASDKTTIRKNRYRRLNT